MVYITLIQVRLFFSFHFYIQNVHMNKDVMMFSTWNISLVGNGIII